VDVQRRWGECGVWVDEGECNGRTDLGKGNTKGGNNKIGMVQGRLEVLRKGWRGRSEQDLTPSSCKGMM